MKKRVVVLVSLIIVGLLVEMLLVFGKPLKAHATKATDETETAILAPTSIETILVGIGAQTESETDTVEETTETEFSLEEHQAQTESDEIGSIYDRPLLKENDLLPDGMIIGHEDDTLFYRDQMTEAELYEQMETYYGSQNASFMMYGEYIDKETEPVETEAITEEVIETPETVVEEAEVQTEAYEEPYYVEEHLDPDADQRYVEESPLWLLAHIMMSEAGYCSRDERLKVGSVVLNRVHHSSFPNTMVEVLYCDNPVQYAPTICPDRFYTEPTEECWEDAQWLLDNGSILPEDVVYQATFPQGSATYEYSEWGEYFCYY